MALEPKAEAKRLVNLFKPKFNDLYLDEYIIPKSKECALLVVDEKINEMGFYKDLAIHTSMGRLRYWQEVRSEIVKIK